MAIHLSTSVPLVSYITWWQLIKEEYSFAKNNGASNSTVSRGLANALLKYTSSFLIASICIAEKNISLSVKLCTELFIFSGLEKDTNNVMNTNSKNMFSLRGCTCETYFPDKYSLVRNPGRLIKSRSVLKC